MASLRGEGVIKELAARDKSKVPDDTRIIGVHERHGPRADSNRSLLRTGRARAGVAHGSR